MKLLLVNGAITVGGVAATYDSTLELGSANALAAVTVNVTIGALLDLNNFAAVTLGGFGGAAPIALGRTAVTFGSDGDSSVYSGALSGAGNLTKVGSGTLTFADGSDPSFTGGLTISAGSVMLVHGSSTASANELIASTITLAGGILDLSGTQAASIGGLAGSGNVSLGSSSQTATALTVGGNNASTTYSGVLSGTGSLTKIGSGTLTLTGTNTYSGGTAVSAGVLQIGSGGATGALPVVGPVADSAALVFDRSDPITFSSVISGSGTLTQAGGGTLTLTETNTYSGGTFVANGTIDVASDLPSDSNLGTGNVTGTPLGTLSFTGSTSTTKSFAMGDGGTITVASGQTVTFNGSQVSGAILDGAGAFATNATSGAIFDNVSSTSSVTIDSNSAADQFIHFTNSSTFNVAGGLNPSISTAVTNLNGFTNQGSGSITVGAGTAINVANFQSYGQLTLVPNTDEQPTVLTNTGSSALFFNGGSQTFIGTPATADPNYINIVDYVDLHGQDAIVTGGLFDNNGGVYDTVGAETHTIYSEYGALVKGAGFFANVVRTENRGTFQSGNCPGSDTLGNFSFGLDGVSNYLFAIDDATGVAGPQPDSAGHVDGWSLVNVQGNFAWTADTDNKLTVNLQTLINPSVVLDDVAGAMDNFDPIQSYVWTAVHWTGTYTGPTDVATLNAATVFDTSEMVNQFGGSFSWQLDTAAKTLSLVYTPPPAVAAVQVNQNGTGSITSISVTFSTPVTFAGGDAAAAFQLQNLTDGNNVAVAATVSTDSLGRTVVTLTFGGSEADSTGALLYGQFALTIFSSSVTDANGVYLDGVGTGTHNGINYVGAAWTSG